MAAETILIQYRADTAKFSTDLKKATTDLNNVEKAGVKAGNSTKQSFDKAGASATKLGAETKKVSSNFSGMGQSLTQIGAAMGVAFGIQQVIQFGKASAEAFIDAEKNSQLLLFSLKGNTQAHERLLAQATKLQNTTIFDDDSIQQAQTFLATQGRTEKQIQKVIDAAVEYSTITGKDLQTSVMMLDATFEGQIGKLGKLDSEFKKLTPEQLANGAAADLLIQKYGGMAEAMGETTAGKIQKLKNQFGELQETIGGEMLPVITGLVDGLNALTKGETIGGLDMITTAFEKMTVIAQLFGPIAGITDAFKSLQNSFKDFQQGNILMGVANGYKAIADVISFGLVDTIYEFATGTKEAGESLSDFQRLQLGVSNATDEEILKTFEDLSKASPELAGNFKEMAAAIRGEALDKTFNTISQSLEVTRKQFDALTGISDKYGISARITGDAILDIKEATDEQLDQAFVKFNKTLGVSRENWDAYVKTIKSWKTLADSVPPTTKAMVGPYDELSNKIAAINKEILDNLTLGKDALTLERQRYELQVKKNEIDKQALDLANSHNQVERERLELVDLDIEKTPIITESIIENTQAKLNNALAVIQLNDAQKDLQKQSEDMASLFGALAQLSDNLSNALTQIFGEAAQDSAAFVAFQKTLTIATITFKSFETIANGIAAFSAGAAANDPAKIIAGIASIVAGVGNAIGGLISEVNSIQTPSAPSFYEGTEYLQRGNNPKGIDTIPVMANEGEAIIPTDKNTAYPGLAKAWINGNLEDYVVSKWVTPALIQNEKNASKDFANDIATSMLLQQGSMFDDYRLFRSMAEGNSINKNGFRTLEKALSRKFNPRNIA